ncbi:unnamed protein product, partial [Brassica napus]
MHCRLCLVPLRTSVLNPPHQVFYHRALQPRTKQASPSYAGAPPRTCCMKTYHISNLISTQLRQPRDPPPPPAHPASLTTSKC